MSVLKKLSQMFSKSSSKDKEGGATAGEDQVASGSSNSFAGGPPVQRRVIQASVVIQHAGAGMDGNEILIKAEPSKEYDQCKFMVNRPLFKGRSWYFSKFEDAAGSPLAEALFSVDTVETVLVHESTAVVTKTGPKASADWEVTAREIGAALRKVLEAETDLLSAEIVAQIPSEDVVRNKIQDVIDTEVNPGVAAHGGRITLTQVVGNTVTIQMGGGCQGCSAADMTLKQGIHNSFRLAVPYVGAIYDETDHSAGSNPYYQ